MKKKKKIYLFILTCIFMFYAVYPAFAAGITMDPYKDRYKAGENIELIAEDFIYEDGVNWYYKDKDGGKVVINEDGGRIQSLVIPKNDTEETVTSVVYAVYGGDARWTEFSIAPKTFKQTSLYPLHKRKGNLDKPTEVCIGFDREVIIDNEVNSRVKVYAGGNEKTPTPTETPERTYENVLKLKDDNKTVVLDLESIWSSGNWYYIEVEGAAICDKNNPDIKFEGIKNGDWYFMLLEPRNIEINNKAVKANMPIGTSQALSYIEYNGFSNVIWESSNSDVIKIEKTVDWNGKVKWTATAKSAGKATIKVYCVGYEDINAEMKINVQVPKDIKLVYLETEKEVHELTLGIDEVEDITVLVLDQFGSNMGSPVPVEWNWEGEAAGYITEDTSGGSATPNWGHISGVKEGQTKATVSVKISEEEYASKELIINVVPQSYEIKELAKFSGGTWLTPPSGYHEMDEKGILFYVTDGKASAIDGKTGNALWGPINLTSEYGVDFGLPQLDGEGNIYVSGIPKDDGWGGTTEKTVLVCLKAEDGSERWSFSGQPSDASAGIRDIRIGEKFIYVLTKNGKLYQINKSDGSASWTNPLAVETNNLEADSEGLRGNGVMLLLKDGGLYISEGDSISFISEDGEKQQIYKETGAKLYLEDRGKDSMILQKKSGEKYELLSIDKEGNKKWECSEISGRVAASSDEDGNVYAVQITDEENERESKAYFLNGNDGAVKKTISLETVVSLRIGDPSKSIFKPVIGADGLVYISIRGVFVLNKSGDLLRTVQLSYLDGKRFVAVPRTMTVDKAGKIFVSAGRRGLIAMTERAETEGLNIKLEGHEHLSLDSCKDMMLKLKNNSDKNEDIVIKTVLVDRRTAEILSHTSFEDAVAAKETKNYSMGIKIPSAGSFKVEISITDKTGKVLWNEEVLINE